MHPNTNFRIPCLLLLLLRLLCQADTALCVDSHGGHSLEELSRCVWGEGDDCAPCPAAAGALCPGGFRLWSAPGFYQSDPTARRPWHLPVPCSEPSRLRCPGWDALQGRSTEA